MEPNHQLHQVAASADNNWSSTKSTQRRVNSSSTQSSIPPNEMSQLEHMQNPVSTQYITRQQEGGDEYWRQDDGGGTQAPLPNNDDAAEVVTDTTESTMAEGEFVLAELRAELLAEIATDTNTESTMAEDNNQPRAEDYTNDDHIGNFVLPTSRADPGFANSEDNTLVLGDSSEIYDMEIDDDGNPKKTVYKPILFPSGASLRDLCTLKINALQTSLFCHCIAFHIHQIPLMKSYKLEHHQRVYQCMCGEYRLKMKSVDRKIRGNLRDFTLDLTYGKQVIIINKEVTKLFHTFGTTCTCDRRSTPIEPALLATMPTYQRWIRKAMHPLTKDYTFQDIKDKLADLNQIVAFKKTSYSNIKASVTNYLCHLISEEYKYLPRFLQTLYQCNVETVSVALQVDSEHRFCRWFHGFPIAKYHGVLTQPPYIVDCFHSKSKMYSGRIFLFASRTGFGRTVIEAIAYIPSESAGHICWLVQMCWRHGMHLEDAIFTDQGPFLSAMNSLNLEFLVNFYVMLCLQHIFRNIQDGFTVLFAFEEEKKLFRSMMNAASFCEDQLTFFKLIFDYLHLKITSCPGKNRHLYITLVLYILRLHPGLWTVFANAPKFDHGHYIHYLRNYILPSLFSSLFINLNFRSNEHMEMEHAGKFLLECRASAQKNTDDFLHKFHNFIHRKQGPCPRFHLARTNTAESQGASFLFCGFRYEPPPIGIPIILKQYNHQIDQLKLDLVRMGRTASYTTTGARLRAVAIDRGFVFDPAYLNFSGAGVANNNTSVDGSHESSNQGCALELLSSNDDVSSHGSCVDSSGYIPQQTQSQSQSSQAGIPADIYPAGGLGTFPTSQTTTNTEEETVAGDDLDTNVGFSFSPTQPPALNPLSRPRLDSDGESVRSQSAENIQIDQEDESFASDDEYARGSDVASDDDGSSTHSFASDAEMTNNTMREAAIVGNFKSIDGRQYDVELNWQYPNIEDYKNQNYKNQKFDPAYTHLCNFCVLNSAMVKFPCHCILRLAQNAAEFDDRFPQHHKREVIKGELPDEFYPRCFLSKRNLELILSASCVLKVRIPTQDLVNKYPVVEPYCKGPPQYRQIIERGYRYTSTGETGASKKKTKAHGHENNKQPKKQKFANCHTESVKVSAPIGEFGKAAKVASREFVHDPELSQSILESNLGKAGQRLCGNCNLPGHTYNQCSAMYSQGEGVVKPKMIVTGKYLVYSVQDENPDSRLRLDEKPTELSAVSSKDLNSRMFLSYRPEEDPKSDEAEQKKKL